MIRSEGTKATLRSRVIFFVLLVAIPIIVLVASIPAGPMLDEAAIDVVGIAAYGGVGGIVIFRRNGHLVGWLLLALGATMMSVSRLEGFPGISPSCCRCSWRCHSSPAGRMSQLPIRSACFRVGFGTRPGLAWC